MKQADFERELARIEKIKTTKPSEYAEGYLRGLTRRHLGGASSSKEIHEADLSGNDDYSNGYRDGYYGPVDWEDLPQAMRIMRRWHDISRHDLGKLVNRSGRTVEQYELGRRRVPAGVLKKLKTIYNRDKLFSKRIKGSKLETVIEQSKYGPVAKQAAKLRLFDQLSYAEIAKQTGINRARMREIEAALKRRAGIKSDA